MLCVRPLTRSKGCEGHGVAEAREYPDGTRVFCVATAELLNGKIIRQVNVQARDE
jgi:hypothetical protein